MMNRVLIPLIALSAIAFGCKKEGMAPAADPHAHAAQHGGVVIEVGNHTAILEAVHDEAAGTMTIYVQESSSPITEAPSIVIGGDRITTQPQGEGQFAVTDAKLEGHPHGVRITVKIGDKTYNPELPHADH